MAWQIDWKVIEPLFFGDVSDKQRDGIESLLKVCTEYKFSDIRWVAYVLTTSYHETARKMQAVREAFWKSEEWRKNNLSYYPYYGRGHVQLTHKENYKKAGDKFGIDLASDPDKALDSGISGMVIAEGMRDGWFRKDKKGNKHTLTRYFSGTADDPTGARKIINGREPKKVGGKDTTVGEIMAGYYEVFLEALTEITTEEAVAAVRPGIALRVVASPELESEVGVTEDVRFDSEPFNGEPSFEITPYYPFETVSVPFEFQTASLDLSGSAVRAFVRTNLVATDKYSGLMDLAAGLNLSDAMERLIEFQAANYPTSNARYWAIFNLSAHSRSKRLHVFDAVNKTATKHLCAHGKGSDTNHDGMAERFSNVSGSNMTSLGVYRCAETYYGANGYSLKLDGLENTNSNARSRAVVIHGANYVSAVWVAAHNKIGRSEGCPAVPHSERSSVIDRLRDGSFLLAWKS